MPEFAEIAWRDGRRVAQRIEKTTVRVFAAAANRVMRDEDLLAHGEGSDWFAVAMLSPARAATPFGAIDARTALERIAATISLETGQRMESGWWPIESASDIDAFDDTRERALERGARERERFEFFATVGHELRTPLTSIRGYIETLLDDEVDPQTTRRFLETARKEALRLARLLDGMLEFSLLDLSAIVRRESSDLVQAVHAAVDTLLPIARESGVSLRADATGEALVALDADACMHALLNIVENGIKYSRRPGMVSIAVEREGPFIRTIVDDNGLGVPRDQHERIFNYRSRGVVPEGVRGQGVGLAIVRAIVERAGGRVVVDNAPAGGARFSLFLPAAQADMRRPMS